MSDPRTLDPRARRMLAKGGWASAVLALAVGGGAIALAIGGGERARGELPGILVLVTLVSAGTAIDLLGAPFARAGRPSRLKIALLFALGAAGTALTVVVDPVAAFGVVFESYIIVVMTMARWPPAAWLELQQGERVDRAPPGSLAVIGALVLAFVAVVLAVVTTTDSRALELAATAVAAAATVRCLVWIASAYARRGSTGRRPRTP